MSQSLSYPIADGVTIAAGLAVAVNSSGEAILADSTDRAIGISVSGGTGNDAAPVYCTVASTGALVYASITTSAAAGVRLQADDDGTGQLLDASALGGRMVGTAAAAAVGGLVLVQVAPYDHTLDT